MQSCIFHKTFSHNSDLPGIKDKKPISTWTCTPLYQLNTVLLHKRKDSFLITLSSISYVIYHYVYIIKEIIQSLKIKQKGHMFFQSHPGYYLAGTPRIIWLSRGMWHCLIAGQGDKHCKVSCCFADFYPVKL